MTYTVKYKHKFSLFWKKIKRVKGDFIAKDIPSAPRVLILEDERRIEIPTDGYLFKFPAERFHVIKKQMEKEAGQPLVTIT